MPVGKVAWRRTSRIALAILVTTSQLARRRRWIFDEVDSGIGGAVAQTVGRLMRQLGRDRQVLAAPPAAGRRQRRPSPVRLHEGRRAGHGERGERDLDETRVQELARMLAATGCRMPSLACAGDVAAMKRKSPMQLVLITGMSGSGKSVALHALEDAGFYCVDNLPPELLEDFIAIEHGHHADRVAIAIDAQRQVAARHAAPAAQAAQGRPAADSAVPRRHDGTRWCGVFPRRRLHPLSRPDSPDQQHALIEAIEQERELLSELREYSLVIDTSHLKASHLRTEVGKPLDHESSMLTLVFESFGFKRGVPMDADYVFDVRMLPNPHYEPELRPLTGLRCAGGGLSGARTRGAGDAGLHHQFPGALAALDGARPPQLRHGSDRLHRRPATARLIWSKNSRCISRSSGRYADATASSKRSNTRALTVQGKAVRSGRQQALEQAAQRCRQPDAKMGLAADPDAGHGDGGAVAVMD